MPHISKHLIIDGNNIGRAWPDTAALWHRNTGAAQSRLLDLVRVWHDVMNWRVTVVFDGRAQSLTVVLPTEEATFVVAHSARHATADTVIEQWVARSRDPETCVVATGDTALASTVNATGASVITPDDLQAWLQRAGETARRRIGVLRREGSV